MQNSKNKNYSNVTTPVSKEELDSEILRFKDIDIHAEKLLIRLDCGPNKTNSGILIPDSILDAERYWRTTGYVIKIGCSAFIGDRFKYWGKFTEKINVGSYVRFLSCGGTRDNVQGLDLYLVPDTDILFVGDALKLIHT